MSVRRVYVERRQGLRQEAEGLLAELRQYLKLEQLRDLRLIRRYDVEGLSEAAFSRAVATIFSEPQTDLVSFDLELPEGWQAFAVSYLPGQFDQRADSASQCIQLMTLEERPPVASATVYLLAGGLSEAQLQRVKDYVINPVESRESDLAPVDSLLARAPAPRMPPVLDGFRGLDGEGLSALRARHELAMDLEDLRFCARQFERMGRDPSLTELKVIDTYWSDHCRHTTFLTELSDVVIEDPVIRRSYEDYLAVHRRLRPGRPVTLMDVATIAARALRQQGGLPALVDSEENNACTIRVRADTPEGVQDWLLLFKNETHNHPTEIEPFGGAATCIGGAIRDPLSARAYVYAAMRVTGAADPTAPVEATLPGKLPQRRIVLGAANGYASYGNQIGLATGLVRELYHPGYAAKRMEVGAVLGAVRESQVRRERPAPGDLVLLVGGRTGRDGIGGATGSSQAHSTASVQVMAAQVQKGNAPEERKLQRLFLNPEAVRLIKRCNDFGAGGVSVAVGELAPGLDIDLDAVPRKYEGLDGTELAISESQERMAVVVERGDAQRFIELARQENLEATVLATVTADERLTMRWQGRTLVSLPRDFLDSNGAPRQTAVRVEAPRLSADPPPDSFREGTLSLCRDLNGCSGRGLSERFDSTIGAGTLLMPFGGRHQLTPVQAMAHLLPVEGGTRTCSFMSFGFDPRLAVQSPYHAGYLAVVEALSCLVAAGASLDGAYLSHQEYFPSPRQDPARWGLPLAALLGAFRAQMELGVAAIGGKDSMSGSFESIDVPPTLISFAVSTGRAEEVVSPELKAAGHPLVWLRPRQGPDGLPEAGSLKAVYEEALRLMRSGKALSCATPRFGGAALALTLMSLGNAVGVRIDESVPLAELFAPAPGSLILELAEPVDAGTPLGQTTGEAGLRRGGELLRFEEIMAAREGRLEGVFPMRAQAAPLSEAPLLACERRPLKGVRLARPRVLIPAFPGTNCEEDTRRAFERAGARAEVLLIRNLSPELVRQSVDSMSEKLRQAQILMIPGGFSGGDEPDGSGKFITAFLRSAPVREALSDLLDRRLGLVGGICNGFQALIKLGLVPFGKIMDADQFSPTLTHNLIGRHQSKLVTVRVASSLSPWYAESRVGDLQTLPISHGEGRLLCPEGLLSRLAEAGQIATQYAGPDGLPSMDIQHNPNGSAWAVESLTSGDGRVMGRMGHAERVLPGLYRNLGSFGLDPLFLSAVKYYN